MSVICWRRLTGLFTSDDSMLCLVRRAAGSRAALMHVTSGIINNFMSMNLETRQQQSCIAYNTCIAVILGCTIQDVKRLFRQSSSC